MRLPIAHMTFALTIIAVIAMIALTVPAHGNGLASSPTETAIPTNTTEPTPEPSPTDALTDTPIPTPAPPPSVSQEEIDANQAKWEAAGIANYRYDLTFSCIFCGPIEVRILVLDGKTYSVTPLTADAREPYFLDIVSTDFSTIDAVFAYLNDESSTAYQLTATFDPTYGYPLDVYVNPLRNLADEEHGLVVHNFVIDPLSLPSTGGPP